MNKSCFFLLLSLMMCGHLKAQLPNTQAYLFDMRQVNDAEFQFANPKYLTAFNSKGYNNQPHFINDRVVYLTVSAANASQTDIYSLDLFRKIKTKVTNTPDSEYSPTVVPNSFAFSCVREENDGQKTQRLWRFPIDRSNNGARVMDMTDVGYHHWITPDELALFIVGKPHKLIITNIRTKQSKQADTDIGRSLQQLPNGNLAYLKKMSEKTWYIKELDTQTMRSKIVIEALAGSEDFIVAEDGTIFSGMKNKLYKFNPAFDKQWVEIADFSAYGIHNITRLAYNGNRKFVLIDKKS